jgi:hypothetical protein
MVMAQGGCSLSKGFSLTEKLYAQLTFNVMVFSGIAGIALMDWRWVPPYLVITAYGVLGLVMRHFSCPRCPHLHVYNDCLQFPPKWTKWLIKERKNTPFTAFERWASYVIFILIPLYPLYWLSSQPVLLGVFLGSGAMWYLGQLLYFCRRCRVRQCPFNQVPAGCQAN